MFLNRFLFIFCQLTHFIFLCFLVSFQFFLRDFGDDLKLTIVLFLVFFGFAIHFIQRILAHKRYDYFSFGFLFLFSYFIVYFHLAMLKIFGFEVIKKYEWFIWADTTNISQPILIAACGLFAYFLGSGIRSTKKISNYKSIDTSTPHHATVQLLTLLAFISYIIFLFTSGSYISGAYARDGSLLSAYAIRLFNILMFGALCIELHKIFNLENRTLSLRQYIKKFYSPLILLLCIHVVMSLIVGDRGPIFTYIILFFSVYFIKYYSLRFLYALLFMLCISFVFSVLGEARTRAVDQSFIERFISASSAENQEKSKWFYEKVPGQNFIELALSVRTLNAVVRDVPSEYDYQYGLFQLQQAVAIVPGLSRIYHNQVFDGDPRYDGTANFITWLIHRHDVDYGDGTSIVADIYLDFGLVGVVLILFAFGRIIAIYEIRLKYEKVEFNFYFLFFMTYLSKSIYLPRSSIMLEFSNILFSLFAIWLMNELVKNVFLKYK